MRQRGRSVRGGGEVEWTAGAPSLVCLWTPHRTVAIALLTHKHKKLVDGLAPCMRSWSLLRLLVQLGRNGLDMLLRLRSLPQSRILVTVVRTKTPTNHGNDTHTVVTVDRPQRDAHSSDANSFQPKPNTLSSSY